MAQPAPEPVCLQIEPIPHHPATGIKRLLAMLTDPDCGGAATNAMTMAAGMVCIGAIIIVGMAL